MEELDRGHTYKLQSLDGDRRIELHFVKRVGEDYPGNTNSQPGTTTQELFRVIIARINYVNQQKSCWQNWWIVRLSICCLYLLELRHYHKHKLGLSPKLTGIHLLTTCDICGHTKCKGHKAIHDA